MSMKKRVTTVRPRQPFDPENDTPICLMVESDEGRILSSPFNTPAKHFKQWACACDVKRGLPTKANPESHALTVDAQIVTCPDCQKTDAFKAAYLNQTGVEFLADDEMAVSPEIKVQDEPAPTESEPEPAPTPNEPVIEV